MLICGGVGDLSFYHSLYAFCNSFSVNMSFIIRDLEKNIFLNLRSEHRYHLLHIRNQGIFLNIFRKISGSWPEALGVAKAPA